MKAGMIMKKNYMAEKCFREIDLQIQREILSDPRKRRQYMEQQEKKKYLEDISKKVRKEMHLYG